MGPALVLAGSLAACLLVLGVALRRSTGPGRTEAWRAREALPWVLAAELVAGALLLVFPRVPVAVVVGVHAYLAVAIIALWRLARLDAASDWMTPPQRRLRLVASAAGIAWLGIVLGLLLWIAEMLDTGLAG
jgi:hypothetical protein